MALKMITLPSGVLVTLAEAKQHLRVDTDDEDDLITAYVAAATEWCAGFQNRAYLTQVLEQSFDDFPDWVFALLRPPLVSVESIKFTDVNNTEYTFDPAKYIVDTDSEPGRISLNYNVIWPTVVLRPINAVRVRFTAGYPDVSKVPEVVKQAIKLLVGHWHANREPLGQVTGEMEFCVKSLLGQNRVRPV
jgi:uncharacterized phiE125 gp8 family phage protein